VLDVALAAVGCCPGWGIVFAASWFVAVSIGMLHTQSLHPTQTTPTTHNQADGHCMYRSIEDQLRLTAGKSSKQQQQDDDEDDEDDSEDGSEDDEEQREEGDGIPSYQDLRELAADHIRAHRDEFAPFLVPEGEGEDAEAHFKRYVDDIEMSPAWGSHVELTALAAALRRKIVVHGVGMTAQVVGEEHGGAPLTLCFLRHALGLGDHFNSTKKLLIAVGGEEEEGEEGDE